MIEKNYDNISCKQLNILKKPFNNTEIDEIEKACSSEDIIKLVGKLFGKKEFDCENFLKEIRNK